MPGGDGGRSGGLLPPITLPPIRLPERFVLPAFGRIRGAGSGVLAAVALDLLDAAAVVGVDAGPVRVGLGTLLALAVLGRPGLLYAVEAAALVGPGWLGLFPTATAIWLLRPAR